MRGTCGSRVTTRGFWRRAKADSPLAGAGIAACLAGKQGICPGERRVKLTIRLANDKVAELGTPQESNMDWPSARHCLDSLTCCETTHNAGMNPAQSKIIELLREVHLLAMKEIERLNLRIVELESERRHSVPQSITVNPPAHISPFGPPSTASQPEMLNDLQVAKYLRMSVASVRRWRVLRQGPKFFKIGSAVRYRKADLDAWLDSLPE